MPNLLGAGKLTQDWRLRLLEGLRSRLEGSAQFAWW